MTQKLAVEAQARSLAADEQEAPLMREITPGQRPPRVIPRYDGANPEAGPQQKHPLYDPSRGPGSGVSFRGAWWVWLSIGISLAVVINALFGEKCGQRLAN